VHEELTYLLSDTEVDKGGLGSDFWLVVWVGQLGLQVQPELAVVLDLRSGGGGIYKPVVHTSVKRRDRLFPPGQLPAWHCCSSLSFC
jgi:hypothetical protein